MTCERAHAPDERCDACQVRVMIDAEDLIDLIEASEKWVEMLKESSEGTEEWGSPEEVAEEIERLELIRRRALEAYQTARARAHQREIDHRVAELTHLGDKKPHLHEGGVRGHYAAMAKQAEYEANQRRSWEVFGAGVEEEYRLAWEDGGGQAGEITDDIEGS